MLIFDIGYNKGHFTSQIRGIYGNVKVIGVDGNSKFSTNNVTFLNKIVSDKVSTETFYICDVNPDISSINPEWIETIRHNHFYEDSKREEIIESTTLDALISEYGNPDIIKLDIEGAELMALNGLTQKSGLVLFEFSEEYFFNAIKCVERLKELGYKEFSYTLNDDHFNPNLNYKNWEDLDLQNIIRKDYKEFWGMIYGR